MPVLQQIGISSWSIRRPEKIAVAHTPGETGTVHPMPDDIDIPATPEQVRAAVAGLKSALDAHLAAVEARAGENDPHVQAAYDALASAGEIYDDALFSAYEEVTPFGPVESDDDEDEEEADAEEDDDLEWEAPEDE